MWRARIMLGYLLAPGGINSYNKDPTGVLADLYFGFVEVLDEKANEERNI